MVLQHFHDEAVHRPPRGGEGVQHIRALGTLSSAVSTAFTWPPMRRMRPRSFSFSCWVCMVVVLTGISSICYRVWIYTIPYWVYLNAPRPRDATPMTLPSEASLNDRPVGGPDTTGCPSWSRGHRAERCPFQR